MTNSREKLRNPSRAYEDSPINTDYSGNAHLYKKEDPGRRNMLFTIDDIHKRGLVWDGYSPPYNPNLIKFARSLRKDMTTAERKLWYGFLRTHDKKFYRQRPIDYFIADFYCSEYALIIEIDGSQHYTPGGIKRDAIRSEILSLYGLEIVRFTNLDVLKHFDAVCIAINKKLQQDPSVAIGDSSPNSGAVSEKPPLQGEVT